MQMHYPNASILRWIDGDTVDCVVDLGFRVLLQQRFRLAFIDTPERGSEGYKEATLRVNQLAPKGAKVSILCTGYDRYGRWIADISTSDSISINQALLNEGLAKLY